MVDRGTPRGGVCSLPAPPVPEPGRHRQCCCQPAQSDPRNTLQLWAGPQPPLARRVLTREGSVRGKLSQLPPQGEETPVPPVVTAAAP